MNTAVILSSGSGERFKNNIPKQFIKLSGLPLLVHTLKAFQNNENIDDIVVVTNQEYIDLVWEYVNNYSLAKVTKVVCGGKTRQESSKIGIDCCNNKTKFVLIHDGVRPFISDRIINRLVEALETHQAVDTVIESADTIVKVNKDQFIETIPDRALLRRGQTPQAFEYKLIKEAHRHAEQITMENSTDDCGLVMQLGHPIYTIPGDEQNIKVTYPIDLHIADKFFQLSGKRLDNYFDDALIKDFFNNKTIAIIGGTSGIGKALSKMLKPLSKHVYTLGRRTTPCVDLLDINSIEEMIKTIFFNRQPIDYIINCAGDLIRKNVEFMTAQEWDYIYNINIRANYLLAKIALPYFKKQNFGNLIFVGSSSYTRGRAGYSAYCSAKAALVNFCQAFAEEVSQFNINVNLVSPTRVDTPLRYRNFGQEDKKTLLAAGDVARKIIQAMMVDTTGSIFEIV